MAAAILAVVGVIFLAQSAALVASADAFMQLVHEATFAPGAPPTLLESSQAYLEVSLWLGAALTVVWGAAHLVVASLLRRHWRWASLVAMVLVSLGLFSAATTLLVYAALPTMALPFPLFLWLDPSGGPASVIASVVLTLLMTAAYAVVLVSLVKPLRTALA